jgi:hypothetical protein
MWSLCCMLLQASLVHVGTTYDYWALIQWRYRVTERMNMQTTESLFVILQSQPVIGRSGRFIHPFATWFPTLWRQSPRVTSVVRRPDSSPLTTHKGTSQRVVHAVAFMLSRVQVFRAFAIPARRSGGPVTRQVSCSLLLCIVYLFVEYSRTSDNSSVDTTTTTARRGRPPEKDDRIIFIYAMAGRREEDNSLSGLPRERSHS